MEETMERKSNKNQKKLYFNRTDTIRKWNKQINNIQSWLKWKDGLHEREKNDSKLQFRFQQNTIWIAITTATTATTTIVLLEQEKLQEYSLSELYLYASGKYLSWKLNSYTNTIHISYTLTKQLKIAKIQAI